MSARTCSAHDPARTCPRRRLTEVAMADPLVSVMMPAFNSAAFVREAVASILGQTLESLELIVIDDGSTDATAEIIGSLADPRLRLVQNPANLGEATSRNIALALARGRYIALLDSDDIAESWRLELQADFLDRHPEVDICGADAVMFGPHVQKTDVPPSDAVIKARFLPGRAHMINPSAVYRRDLVVRHGLRYRADLIVGADFGFWVDCMRAGARFANIKQYLVRYRWHGNNLSGRVARMKAAQMRVRRQVISDFFPALTGRQAEAFAVLFAGEPLTFDSACAAVAAARIAQADGQSRFGESREELHSIIEVRVAGVHQALRGQSSATAARSAVG
jgi:glycosyltransferase involved in cell wall biosynthesis